MLLKNLTQSMGFKTGGYKNENRRFEKSQGKNI